ncbi:MAG: PIN domain-containing protein [Bacteroidales bacterium]|nr:PIN domain-containing protein [Bacteroidales bacterium]
MNRIFLDTNVLLDVLLHREPFLNNSAHVLNMGFKGEIDLYATPLSFTTCLFVARKSLGYTNTLEALKILERHIRITTMDAAQLHEALYATAPDFEDMLQYHAAVTAKCSHIITRNEQHFPTSGIAVMSPTAFMQAQLAE